MSDVAPPEWGDDPFSRYFKMAEYNDRASAANYPAVFELLRRTNAVLETAEGLVHRDGRAILLIPRFLQVRVRSAFLAASRLALSGQLVEAHAVLRQAIEEAWYALHIATEPDPPALASGEPSRMARWEIWMRRTDDSTAKRRCKDEFTVKNVRSSHERIDPATAAELYSIYETLIDFGAHPNEQGLFAAMTKQENDREIEYQIGILAPHELPLMFTLRLAVAVAVGALKIFQKIYPERFALMSVDQKIDMVVGGLNKVFKRYVPKSGQ
jgi:hypothetical protein